MALRLAVTRVEQDLMRDLAKSYISGKRHPTIPQGDVGTPRTMDGLIHSILEGTNQIMRMIIGREMVR